MHELACIKHNFMSIRQLLQKWYIIYMEDNHSVILDKYPSNRLFRRIQMTSNRMFSLTLKPTMKIKIAQAIYESKCVHSDTAFKEEGEEGSVHNSKKEEDNDAKLKETFQSEVRMIPRCGVLYLGI
jgi:hypothetical protein